MEISEKKATTADEQIEKLKKRGMVITNEEKAKENLLDIGYYRLGFYWYPFEQDHPTHTFYPDTQFDYAIKLYYFDYDLRNILLRYISRIEVNFRTTIVYYVSNEYRDNPFWYVDSNVIKQETIESRTYQNALDDVKKEPIIKRDMLKYQREYAPAWKALEFMPFGTIIKLYESLINPNLKCRISNIYGISSPSKFTNYINTIRTLRNNCAHGKVLYDLRLPQAIVASVLGDLGENKTNFYGAYCVFRYMLEKVSKNRVTEMKADVLKAFERIPYQILKDIIADKTGLSENYI